MRYKIHIIYMLFGLILVQYQNCAPSEEALQGIDSDQQWVDGIDAVRVGDISFAQVKVAAYSDEDVQVAGVCGQEGSLIHWTLRDADDVLIERGHAPCELGAFAVDLGDQWKSFCEQELYLKAELGVKAVSETIVEAHCLSE